MCADGNCCAFSYISQHHQNNKTKRNSKKNTISTAVQPSTFHRSSLPPPPSPPCSPSLLGGPSSAVQPSECICLSFPRPPLSTCSGSHRHKLYDTLRHQHRLHRPWLLPPCRRGMMVGITGVFSLFFCLSPPEDSQSSRGPTLSAERRRRERERER